MQASLAFQQQHFPARGISALPARRSRQGRPHRLRPALRKILPHPLFPHADRLHKNIPLWATPPAFRPLYAEPGRPSVVYERSDTSGRFAIAVNPGEPARSVELADFKGVQLVLAEGAKISGNTLFLNGVSFAILQLTNTPANSHAT